MRSRGRFVGSGLRPRFFPDTLSTDGKPVSGSSVCCTAGVILIGGLLGFIEETVDVLFAARGKTMQACQRQFFLELDDTIRELTVLRLQRGNAR